MEQRVLLFSARGILLTYPTFCNRLENRSWERAEIMSITYQEERLTDFAYWLYVTDLGVDREYEGQGIGRTLMKRAHEIAGGEQDIAVYLIANEDAIPFYEKLGMKLADDVMQYNKIQWTDFTVE